MVGLFRAIGALVRTVVVITLVAVALLVGLSYLDHSGVAQGKVRGVLAGGITPGVVTAVEETGGTVAAQVGDLFGDVLSEIDRALGERTLGEPTPSPTRNASSRAEDERVLDLINDYRVSRELEPWRWDERLAAFAQTRADDLIERAYFSHHDPGTKEVLLARLPTLVSVGENLFQVSGPAVRFMRDVDDEVLKGWRNSPSHNELLLAPRMTRGGVAFARTETRIVVVLIAAE